MSETLSETFSVSIPSPEEKIISEEYVYSLTKSFDQQTQKILLLRYEGYSFVEIAEILEINQSTIRSKYSRAIKKLAQLLGDGNE